MIEIYGTEVCSYCNSAKALLDNRGIFYKFHLIGTDVTREDIVLKFPDKKSVPIIVVDGRILDDGYTSLRKEINEIEKTQK